MSGKSQHEEWSALKDAMMKRHAKKMNIILDTLEDEEFAVQYFKLLEYVQPKLQRQEVQVDTAEDLVITVEYIKSLADENKEKQTSINSRNSDDSGDDINSVVDNT